MKSLPSFTNMVNCNANPPKEIAIKSKPKTDIGGRVAKLLRTSNPSLSMDVPCPKKVGFELNIHELF